MKMPIPEATICIAYGLKEPFSPSREHEKLHGRNGSSVWNLNEFGTNFKPIQVTNGCVWRKKKVDGRINEFTGAFYSFVHRVPVQCTLYSVRCVCFAFIDQSECTINLFYVFLALFRLLLLFLRRWFSHDWPHVLAIIRCRNAPSGLAKCGKGKKIHQIITCMS